MEAAVLQRFKAPRDSFGQLDAESAASLLSAATDVALVLNADGVIEDLSLGTQDPALEACHSWVGRRFADTVTVECRPKVEELLRDAVANKPPRWRHLNHPSSDGSDIPIVYSAVEIGDGGRVIALGRDIRPLAVLQRRLVDAQQSMERDYLRLRQAETRYRMLFHIASEAVLIVDAASRVVIEANPAAGDLLGEAAERLVGTTFPRGFDSAGTDSIVGLFAAVRSAGKGADVTVRLHGDERDIVVSASLLRQDESAHFVVRLNRPQQGGNTVGTLDGTQQLANVIDRVADGIVLTDQDGRVITANRAFVDMAQLGNERQARGQFLENWIGLPGVDVVVLLANLRERGTVRLFKTTLRDEYRTTSTVEICAVAVEEKERVYYAFTVRNIEHRLLPERTAKAAMPRSVDQLTELVGRVPLKDLVREATDLVERLCIEAALELTGDNRASAAEILGLSRQSLYVKLRRHGLGDLPTDDDQDD